MAVKRNEFPARHELKYFISDSAYYQLRSLLTPVLHRDRHANARGEYFIRSLYFDDAYDSAYHGAYGTAYAAH